MKNILFNNTETVWKHHILFQSLRQTLESLWFVSPDKLLLKHIPFQMVLEKYHVWQDISSFLISHGYDFQNMFFNRNDEKSSFFSNKEFLTALQSWKMNIGCLFDQTGLHYIILAKKIWINSDIQIIREGVSPQVQKIMNRV